MRAADTLAPEVRSRRYLVTLGLFLALAIVASLALRLNVAGCAGFGYGPGVYLAQCSNNTYGDYEHAVLALDLEPVRAAIERAQVVFFGHSHAYLAFSGENTERFLGARNLPFYDLALSGELSGFPQKFLVPLIHDARVVVIDVDPFFYPGSAMTRPAKLIAASPVQSFMEYRMKRALQVVHRAACEARESWGRFLCGRAFSTFRRLDNGNVLADFSLKFGRTLPHIPVGVDPVLDEADIDKHLPYARDFVEHLNVPRRCIIFTDVPSSVTRARRAEAMARALDVSFVEPAVADLATVDTGHLDSESVAAWSAAFWTAAEPIVDACTGSIRSSLKHG